MLDEKECPECGAILKTYIIKGREHDYAVRECPNCRYRKEEEL